MRAPPPSMAATWNVLQLSYFPIVISDWQMPEVSGPELCRRIRERADGRYTYVILVTATGGKQRYLEGMEAGADGCCRSAVYGKRIRDAGEQWESIERYVEARSEAQFSHG